MEINNKYIEVAAGGVSSRGAICKADELAKYLSQIWNFIEVCIDWMIQQ